MIDEIAAWVGGIISTVLGRHLAAELKAWTPWVVERLVSRAVAGLPEDQRERFGEEWRSHIDEIPGQIGRVVVALGFIYATRKISVMSKAGREEVLLEELAKRAIDLIICAGFLLVVAPTFGLVALMVRLQGQGPVMVKEPCVGRGGRTFERLKFRTFFRMRTANFGQSCF